MERYNTTVIIVPPDSLQLSGDLVHLENGVELIRGNGDALVSAGMPRQSNPAEHVPSLGVFVLEQGSRPEAVDEERLPAQ